jgi:CRISPR/Cas system-associated exonuclease Cas4 (RecB family)
MEVSYTKLSLYQKCPLAYRFNYVDKVPKLPVPAMHNGIIAHKLLEMLGKTGGNWDAAQRATIIKYHDYGKTIEIANELKSWFTVREFINAKEFEYPVLFDYNGFTFKGFIDRLDYDNNVFEIVDYKYGNFEHTHNEIEESLQSHIYAFAIMQKFNVDKVQFLYHNLKQQTKYRRTIRMSELRMPYIESLAQSLVESLEDKDVGFPAKPSTDCMWCQFTHICEPYKLWIKSNYSLEGDSIESVVTTYILLRDKVRTEKKNTDGIRHFLRAYMDQNELDFIDSPTGRITRGDVS